MVAYRRAHNLSQRDAAKKLGVSQSAWNLLELGKRNASEALAKKIRKVCGLTVRQLAL